MNPSSVMGNVTPCPTAGDQVTYSVMVAVTSGISDAVYRTAQLCLYQPTQGDIYFCVGDSKSLTQCERQCSPYNYLQDIF